MVPFDSSNHFPPAPTPSLAPDSTDLCSSVYNFVIARILYKWGHASVTFGDRLFSLSTPNSHPSCVQYAKHREV